MNMQELFMRRTLDSICKVGFGVGVGIGTLSHDLPNSAFAKAFDTTKSIVTLRFVDPLWRLKRFIRVGSKAILAKCIKVVDEFTYDAIGKGKVTPTEIAFIVERFLADNNYENTLAAFRSEASDFFSKAKGKEVPKVLLGLGDILDEYISLMEAREVFD